jgi:peptidyl-prolyl cis-trans isomerase C
MAGFGHIEGWPPFCRGFDMLSRSSLAVVLGLALTAAPAAAPARAADPAPLAPAGAPAPAAAASALPPANTVVARVDGVELRLADVEAAQQSLPPQAQKLPLAQIYPILLDRLVDGELVTEAGRKEHLDQAPAVQDRLKLYEDHLIQQAYVDQLLKGAESEDQLKARYQKLLQQQQPREEVRARHILVKTEAEAKSIIAQLDKGADFATLAKKYSTDPGAASGGDLGYFTRDDMVPAFAAAAFALPVGKYTETPVKTEFGWHVILVEDRRVKKPPSFDEARAQLTHLAARDIIQAKLKELRSGAKIETYGLDGKPLPPAK